MTHHWDASVVLDIPYETVAASWDNQVDVLVELQECRDLGSGLYRLNVCARDGRLRKSALDRLRQQLRRLVRFFASFQNGSISCVHISVLSRRDERSV